MRKRLGRHFFEGRTLDLASSMLGKFLVRKYKNRLIAGKIVETEAYIGPKDKASHAFGCKVTPRNIVEYKRGGYVYIYLVYGMYFQFNITTFKEGTPECVLIRALEPYGNYDIKISNGPGKLCRFLKLDNSFYGEDITLSDRLWVEDRGFSVKKSEIEASPRIGIDYAGPYWSKVKWRFYIKNNPAVSKL